MLKISLVGELPAVGSVRTQIGRKQMTTGDNGTTASIALRITGDDDLSNITQQIAMEERAIISYSANKDHGRAD